MTFLYIIISLLTVAVLLLLLLLVSSKKKQSATEARYSLLSELNARSESESQKTIKDLREGLENKRQEAAKLSGELARYEVQLNSLREQAQRDKEELEKLQASFRAEFRNLANEILDEKTLRFKETNKEEISALLNPFRENIHEFRSRVEKIYSEDNTRMGALQNEIKNLLELNHKITEETNNLTNALKGNSKVQGDWGEMILQTILENSHLIHGIHYSTQQNFKDEDGNNLRPDVVLHLPDRKQIVIDSKVSLTAYVNYCGEDNDEQRKAHLKAHLTSVRRHVDELGSKRYQALVESPDFVIMFVPNEPAFMCALQNDNSIWSDAYNKKVIISSPTNLFALLKIVDDLWKRDNQSRNAIAIADEGAKLYDKFVGFVETLESLGRSINSAQTGYDKAMNQLKTGSGNLVGRTEKLRKLGIKASKALSKSLTAQIEEESSEYPEETI